MNTIARKLREFNWREFSSNLESDFGYRRFLFTFFSIWAVYDLFDLIWGGSAIYFSLDADSVSKIKKLSMVQGALLICEAAVLIALIKKQIASLRVRSFIAFSFLLRLFVVLTTVPLNDFYYYLITLLIVLQIYRDPIELQVNTWPRQVLRVQTAWIYFATALFKINPEFISGDHLWVRLNYLIHFGMGFGWLHSTWLNQIISSQAVNHFLAVGAICAEMAVAVLLATGAPRKFTLPLAIAIHGFAAISVNVWFFGASMIAQVYYVTESKRPPQSAPK